MNVHWSERQMSQTLLSSLLIGITYRLTVLASTVCFLETSKQVPMDVEECIFSHTTTSLLRMHFHVNYRLVATCNKAKKEFTDTKVHLLLPCHQHPPLTLWTELIKYETLLLEQPL